ncbi:MAG: HD domain-containing phosphohydrolase [Chlamydiales bacterium]|nr:HD domain-containing phosphohydrolase [Chlamydiales bacterium]
MSEKDLFKTLKKLTEIGVALSAERDKRKLLGKILDGAKELTFADGGTLYTITDQKKLRFEIVRTDSLGISWERLEGKEHDKFLDIALIDKDGILNDKNVVAYAVNHDQIVNIQDAYKTEGFDFSGTRNFDATTGYHSQSFLTVPLKNHEADIIGALQLINAKDVTNGSIIPFTQENQELVASLASQAAVAMTNQRLIHELRIMFESLTHVLAEAIDEKSPVTGKHCKRVPIIAQMLAHAVNNVTEGPLKDTKFSDAELYELDIAALLHDCGKVTTPVHVVEKGKKLETIMDRIQLIEARFEIIRRDAEVFALCSKLKQETGQSGLEFLEKDEELNKKLHGFEDDLNFIKSANFGKEGMSAEALERIQKLAATMWKDVNGVVQPLLTNDEVKNLSIVKGTLTTEERLVIQNHVVMTIKMLSEIPYPKYLREVPEIAGKHHERIDGKGYPRGLTGNQMSVRARILAISDVFEALTAPDRPYKDVMVLSRAINILNSMCEEGHIDKDLWKVFLDKKVYAEYAQKYLLPEQIDLA